MICHNCRSTKSKVIDTRAINDGLVISRRRRCLACHTRWSTHEHITGLTTKETPSEHRRKPQ